MLCCFQSNCDKREKQNKKKLYVQEDYYYNQTDTKLTEALKTHIIHTYTTRDIMNITSMAIRGKWPNTS